MRRILTLLFLLGIISICPAAHFEHYESRLWSQVGGWAEDADESDPYDDPGTGWREQNLMSQFDIASVHSFASSSVSSANCSQDGTFTATITDSTLTLNGSAAADANMLALDGVVYSYAGFTGVQPGVTSGIYYKIMPDEGESEGDLATINLTLTGNGLVTGSGQATLGGGGFGSNDVVVTVNLAVPAPEPFDAQHIAYSYPQIKDVQSFSVNDTATFKVKVGHTIAIFLGADVSVTLGPDVVEYTEMSADAQMTLNIVDVSPYTAVCDECDLDGSGTIDMGDLAMVAAAWLADAYSFPDPSPTPDPGTDCSVPLELWTDWPESGYLNVGESVWYEFHAEDDGCYTFSLCNSEFNTAIELYDECGEYLMAFDNDGCEPQSKLQVNLNEWENYFIRIRGNDQWYDSGYYEIEVSQGCSGGGSFYGGDDCQDAPTLELDQEIYDDTAGATGNDETMECGYYMDDRDLWYHFAAPYDGEFMFELYYDSNFDGTLSTWDGCDGYEYNCTESDDGYAHISEFLLEGEERWIRVGSYEYGEGDFSLVVYEMLLM